MANTKAAAEGSNGKVTFRLEGVEAARRMQNERDRALGIARHYMDVPIYKLEEGLASLSGPNPRPEPSTNKKVARQIEASLLNQDVPEPDVFHLAHLGITIVGDVEKIDEATYDITFTVDPGEAEEPSDGIVNGLHSLAVIEKVLRESEVSRRQYITLNVISGIPTAKRESLIPWIARGRNTVLQVKDESIDNLMNMFDPFKEELKNYPYYDQFGWEESATMPYDVLDLLSVMTALNSVAFPNDATGEDAVQPFIAYEKQSACLKQFEKDPASYEKMIPILADALHLYDAIRGFGIDAYNTGKRQGGHLRIIEKKVAKDGKARPNVWSYPFYRRPDGGYGATGTYRLSSAGTFPILAAFRVFVMQNKAKTALEWDGGFPAVLDAWGDLGEEMMLSCVEVSQSVQGNINAVGKNRPLWRSLHKTVKGYASERENARLREQLAKSGTKG
jgi:AIPR protein